jgi:hypothetical protein
MDLATLWDGLVWPLIRLMFFISVGLIIGNLIEALNWTHGLARVASPLVRLGRLKDISGAAFTLAFFSPVAANTMLAENFETGELTRRELILSNLFNSLPVYFMHLPTMFFITVPFIGQAAFVYVGLTFSSAILRTATIVLLGHFFLPPLPEGCVECRLEENRSKSLGEAFAKAWKRFRKRLPRIGYLTVPIYTTFFFLSHYGVLDMAEEWAAGHVGGLEWLKPQTVSIIILQAASEFTGALAAAGAMLDKGVLATRDLVVAMLVGNILSSPMRAMRQQFPYYAGIFKAKTAVHLILASQATRMGSLVVVLVAYAWLG